VALSQAIGIWAPRVLRDNPKRGFVLLGRLGDGTKVSAMRVKNVKTGRHGCSATS